MPPGTDCPYPIRILAFFEMIRPYHVVIRIWGKLLKNNLRICEAKQNSFIVDTTSFFRKISNKKTGDFASVEHDRPNPTVAPSEVKLRFWFFAAGCRFLLHHVAIFWQTASRYESRERFRDKSMHKLRIRIDTDFHWTNTDFPHEIVACLHYSSAKLRLFIDFFFYSPIIAVLGSGNLYSHSRCV